MTTLMNLAAAALIGIVICFLIVAIVFMTLSNDVPRLDGIDTRKGAPTSRFRWLLAVILIAALIGVILHFLL